ncbi:MAG TPA: hypothetical protein ENN85_10295 [Methanoculleus sp.]|nr:hypothetical protein [Methanoculleus sp.]
MSLIRGVLFAGALAYIAVALLELAATASIAMQAIAAGVFLAATIALTVVRDEIALKRYEMALLWICVLLFGAYTIAGYGGGAW